MTVAPMWHLYVNCGIVHDSETASADTDTCHMHTCGLNSSERSSAVDEGTCIPEPHSNTLVALLPEFIVPTSV